MTTKVRERIELATIDDNPWQPRGEIEPEALEELANSIQHMGLLQAPLGRPVGGRVQLAFGHRRVAALKLLHQRGDGEGHVDMDVTLISDEDMAVMGLTENERRKDLSQMETLRAYRKALDETELTATDLAEQLGMALSTLSNNLRVLELPHFILEHVESGDLGMTVAREFLVLQNCIRPHLGVMQKIVRFIVDVDTAGGRPPNWSRKNVRKHISELVSHEEQDFRPLGPKTGHETGGGNREANFDVKAFADDYPDCLHTIPADDGDYDRSKYRAFENYDKSRIWTCEVREWRRRQSAATREANAQAAASGGDGDGGNGRANAPKPPSKDKQFENLLARDPVFKQVVFSREKSGANRPLTDEERAALGTRAELKEISYDTGFWKILARVDPSYRWDLESMIRERGGTVPPWFPIDECKDCTIGAAYAKSRNGYQIDKVTLCCFNMQCYRQKAQRGEAVFREKTLARKRGVDRQDERLAAVFAADLAALPEGTRRTLAMALLSATDEIPGWHAFDFHHDDWCFDSVPVATIRELLAFDGRAVPPEAINNLAQVAPDDLLRLLAALMTIHLRADDNVSEAIQAVLQQHTAKPEPAQDEPIAEEPAADTRQCTGCGEDKALDAFGQQKKRAADGSEYIIPKAKCKECLVKAELARREASASRELAAVS